IEHFGELADVAHGAYEMGRVLKPGGILSLSTELRLSGPEGGIGWPGLTLLLSVENLMRYIVEASGLELVDGLDPHVTEATYTHPRQLDEAGAQMRTEDGRPDYARLDFPHLLLRYDGYVFTSVHLALRKPRGGTAPNEWARPTEALRASIRDGNREAAA